MSFRKQCPHCHQVVSLSDKNKSKVDADMLVCEHCGSEYRLQYSFFWIILNTVAFFLFLIWVGKPEEDMTAAAWMPIVAITLWVLGYKFLITLTTAKKIGLLKKLWLQITGRYGTCDINEQEAITSTFFMQGANVLLMRKKRINMAQCCFLLDNIIRGKSIQSPIEAAILCTRGMQQLQDHTSYLQFPYLTDSIGQVGKTYKKDVIIWLYALILLEGNPQEFRGELILTIATNIGAVASQVGYLRLYLKACKVANNYKPTHPKKDYQEAFELLYDALRRSQLRMG